MALREARSVPVLARIKTWRDAEGQVVLPRSPMGAAIAYAMSGRRSTHASPGSFVSIDNNESERALKRESIVRKTGCSQATTPQRRITPDSGR
jgi:hypothetical protein